MKTKDELKRNLSIGLIYGLVAGLFAGLIHGLIEGLVAGLVYGLVAGLVVGLVFGFFGLVAGLVDYRSTNVKTNQKPKTKTLFCFLNRYEFVIKMLKEMSLNYKYQYPKEISNMNLVVDLILDEVK